MMDIKLQEYNPADLLESEEGIAGRSDIWQLQDAIA